MQARDVMVSPVITVKQSSTVREVAETFLKHRISGAPVVDDQGKVVGVVSEGDLMHRAETGTERKRSWWLLSLTADQTLATDYVKAHSCRVADIMSRHVITAAPDTPVRDIAEILEKSAVKRLPIMENGQLVGIVSRANLVQAVASSRTGLNVSPSDTAIRDKLLAHLKTQSWAHTGLLNITVTDGVVDLWGMTSSNAERKALRVAAECAPGVHAVNDHLFTHPVRGWQ
jgi:CBS-domain-containing membrane protein